LTQGQVSGQVTQPDTDQASGKVEQPVTPKATVSSLPVTSESLPASPIKLPLGKQNSAPSLSPATANTPKATPKSSKFTVCLVDEATVSTESLDSRIEQPTAGENVAKQSH